MSEFTTGQSPSGQQEDELRLSEAEEQPRSSLGQLVLGALEAMNAAGEDAEERFQEALGRLRERAGEAVIVITRMECEVPRQDYATRWALVYLVGELEDRMALPLLRQIVLTPIPPEKSRDPHSSTVAEETIIRTTAVDAVAALARMGEEEAVEALMEFFDVPSFSIRRAAVQGLLSTPKADDVRDRIRACLPEDQHFLLDLKPMDVRKAEQIDDPQRHLSERGKADDTPAAPDVTDRSEAARSIFQQKKRGSEIRRTESDRQGESPAAGDTGEEG